MTQDLETPPSYAPLPPIEEPKKKSNTPIIIVVVVLVLLCCCCLFMAGVFSYLWNYGDQIFGTGMQILSLPI